jgi:hypothetical protein
VELTITETNGQDVRQDMHNIIFETFRDFMVEFAVTGTAAIETPPNCRTSPHKHIQALFLPVRRKIFFFLSILNFFILRKKTNTNVLHFLSPNIFPSLTVTPATRKHWLLNETQPPKLKLRFTEKKRKNQI